VQELSPFLVWTLKALLVQTRERKEVRMARLLHAQVDSTVWITEY
jgi:hypothetical protein